jgi:hypothetical protein
MCHRKILLLFAHVDVQKIVEEQKSVTVLSHNKSAKKLHKRES